MLTDEIIILVKLYVQHWYLSNFASADIISSFIKNEATPQILSFLFNFKCSSQMTTNLNKFLKLINFLYKHFLLILTNVNVVFFLIKITKLKSINLINILNNIAVCTLTLLFKIWWIGKQFVDQFI